MSRVFARDDAGWSSIVSSIAGYAAAALAVGLATLVTVVFHEAMGTSVSILFFPAIIATAVFGGYGPALFGTVLSTISLAYFFVPPYYSLDIGTDDVIRLMVFAGVGVAGASLSVARRRALRAQQQALAELQSVVNTLRKVSDWPVFVDTSIAGGVRRLLDHAAAVVGSAAALVVWETEDEPWVYLAQSSTARLAVTKYPATELDPVVPPPLEHATFFCDQPVDERTVVTIYNHESASEWRGLPMHSIVATQLEACGPGLVSAPFTIERLKGRVFLIGVDIRLPEFAPLVEVVTREIGNSLDQLHLHDRLQQLAIREEQVRVARDLHDGVLQALTGIRFQLQGLADEHEASSSVSDRLLALERAIAIEQRELRLFIEDLTPSAGSAAAGGPVGDGLAELRERLIAEWHTPLTMRVTPLDLSLPGEAERAIRLLVREAVGNAVKHAHPSRVSVDVMLQEANELRVVVRNDGRGFPFLGRLEHHELEALNGGPLSLRHRIRSLGGTLAIESSSNGSVVEISLPLESFLRPEEV